MMPLVLILPFFNQEKTIANLTERLAFTQFKIETLEAALVGQISGLRKATNSTTGQLSELRNIWKAVNATIEETANLIKVILISQ